MEKNQSSRKQEFQSEELIKSNTNALSEAQAQLQQAIFERKRAQAEQARLLEAERAQTQRQSALLRLSSELAATLDESEVCWRVVMGLKETLGYDIVVIMLLDEDSGERLVAANIGYGDLPERIKPGEGLSERPLLDGKLHYTPDVSKEPNYYPGVWGCEVDVPIRIGGKVLGVLSAERDQLNAFDQNDFEVLTAASNQAGLAIEKARLLNVERQRADELEALHTTMADINAELELSSLLQAIVERASVLLNASGGELGLYEETKREVRIVVSHNLGEGYVGTSHVLGDGAMGRVAEIQEPIIIEDYQTWEARAPRYAELDIHGSIAVPLMIGSRLVGVITIVTTDAARKFSQADLHLLSLFAQQAAIAIENARLYDQAKREINERLRAEAELRRQMEYFKALFVDIPVAAMTADLEAKVVSWNPMAEKLFGYTQEEAIGRHVDDLVANDPKIRQEALNFTQRVLTEGRIQALTKRTRKDGSLVDVELRGLPVLVSEKLVGYISIYHDVSELQIARRTAETANKAKSAFLANMSHELRTPLNAILGFTQLMSNDPNLTVEQQQNLKIINRSGEHLLTLINDVLEMSKIEAGRLTLQEKNFDLYRLLDTLEEMFHLQAENKGLNMSLIRSDYIPQYIRLDEGKLRQVLMNLMGNAIKFTVEGGVTLRIDRDINCDHLAFEIEDTGPGIAEGELEKVFEPFVQTGTGESAVEGTGLGLSISRQFARLMGGDITVTSEVEQGSIFRLEVPYQLADEVDFMKPLSARQVLGLAPGQATYRLLIVDDSETTRQLLVKLLQPLGFKLREAGNGQEALEIWEQWQPHLIWMDMRMPVLDGYEATRKIKASPKGRETLIIALTASVFEEDREPIMSVGCDDVVRKPFKKEEIFDKLTQHLGVRFLFADKSIKEIPINKESDQDWLSPAALAGLPSTWLTQLQQATIKANLELILEVIDQIRGQNAALADSLTNAANNFEYKKILTLIEQVGESR